MRHPFLRTLAGSAATPTDPNFENVTLLLHGDGTNGGQNNTFVDGSTNNFTITRNGNTTQGTFSPYGDNWSNFFDGTDDYLSIADNANLRAGSGTFTIEAWIYRNATGAAHTIYAKGGASTGIVFQVTSTDVLRFTHTTTNIDSTGTIGLATWTHVAVVREGTGTNETKLYINGTQDGAGTVSTDFTQTEEVRIGTNRGATDDFNGYISNLRFVKGTAVYTGTFTVPTSPLTAISNTQLLTCKSNRFRDESANAFTVTRNNNVSVQRFSPFSPTAAYAAGTIGGGGYFDGTGDYLSIAGSTAFNSTGDFTMEAWIYLNSRSAFAGIISLTESNLANGGRIAILNTGYLEYAIGTSLYNSSLAPLSEWSHVAMVRSGAGSNNVSCYLNGTRVGQFTSTAQVNAASNVCVIGRYYANGTNQYWLNGYISDPRYVVGTAVYSGTTLTAPSAPLSAISNTQLLVNFQNAAILDNAMMAVPETVGNAQIDTTTKKFGTGSLEFDGNGDSVDIANTDTLNFGTGDFTVECWCYFDSLGGANYAPVFANAYLFYVGSSGQMLLFNGTTNVASGPNGAITTGVWTHLAWTRSSGTVRLFVDGTQTGSNATVTASIGSATPNRLGRYSTVYLDGFIDDLRITKGVARYTANFTAPTAAFPDL